MTQLVGSSTSLTSRSASALGASFYVLNIFQATASGIADYMNYYLSGGSGGGKVIPVVYSVIGAVGSQGPSSLIGYGPEITVASNQAAGLVKMPLSTKPTIASGTYYAIGLFIESGAAVNGWKGTTQTTYFWNYTGTPAYPPQSSWGTAASGNGAHGTSGSEDYVCNLNIEDFIGWGMALK